MTIRRTAVLIVAAVLLIATVATTAPAYASFTASVNNTTNKVASGTSFLTATNTSACTSVPSGSTIPDVSAFTCADKPFPNNVTGNYTSDVINYSNTGTVPFNSASFSATSCGVVQLNNRSTTSDPMLIRGGTSYKNSGPLSGSNSMTFNGTDTYATDVTRSTGPYNFSIGVWFKTSTAQGAVMSYMDSADNSNAGSWDRHIYFNSTGRISFGVYPNAIRTVTSARSYNDGSWHFAVATLTSANLSSTQSLYVDGSRVATQTYANVLNQGAQVFNGWWQIGRGKAPEGGWGGNGYNFNGSLSNAMTFNRALSATEVSSLYSQNSQSNLETRATALGVVNHWALNDDGLTTYNNTLPTTSINPCSAVQITAGPPTSCVYPNTAELCPGLNPDYTVASLVSAGPQNLPLKPLGQTEKITITLQRNNNYNYNPLGGLHLLVPLKIDVTGFNQTFTWPTNETLL